MNPDKLTDATRQITPNAQNCGLIPVVVPTVLAPSSPRRTSNDAFTSGIPKIPSGQAL